MADGQVGGRGSSSRGRNLGQLAAKAGEALRVAQKLYDLLQLRLGLARAEGRASG